MSDATESGEVKTPIVPSVGMGATAGYGSDCYPYTVIKVSANGRTITVQADKYYPAPDHRWPSNQNYICEPEPLGETKVFTLRDNGRWVLKGESMRKGLVLHLGYRRHYLDPSF